MKTLLLMRHAKSSWSQHDLSDHDRPLNARGRDAAPKMAQWLSGQGQIPDHVFVSSAARTRETWALMAEHFPTAPSIDYVDSLYHSGPETMLGVINGAPDTASTVLLIAHQPGMSAMAANLSDGTHGPDQSRAFSHYPTAAISTFRSEATGWAELEMGRCAFVSFAVPRELD